MATIKPVNVADAQAQVKTVQAPQTPAAPATGGDIFTMLTELLGKGLAAASGNEMAVGFANDVKKSNDARRMAPFVDALARGENPAMPVGLGAEALTQAQGMSSERTNQNLVATLQMLKNLQDVASTQGQIDSQQENIATTEKGATQRQGAQIASAEKMSAADIEAANKRNAASVGAQNYATKVQKMLGDEQNSQGLDKLRLLKDEYLRYGPKRPGLAGTGSNAVKNIGPLLDYIQGSSVPDAQKKMLTEQVLGYLTGTLSGNTQQGQQGLDMNDPWVQMLLMGDSE